MDRPHVVIVGAGFGGLNAAKEFEFSNVRVTIVDRQNHHLFQPLLYQVATAALAAPDVAAPIRKILSDSENTTVLMDEVTGVDFDARRVHLKTRDLAYDYLIIAAGMRNHYFGHDEWKELAPGLKTLDDALSIRRRVLLAYEAAELEQDEARREEWLTFVVIGGGATGVELAGALREIAERTLARNFRNFEPRNARVFLLEGADAVLGAMPKRLRLSALDQLRELGVEVRLGTYVNQIAADHVVTADGEEIRTRTVVWAAGVEAESLANTLGVEQDKAGRIVVDDTLNLSDHREVYVIGDIAACTDGNGVRVPGLAPAAIQMGGHAAVNIKRDIAGREPLAYEYVDKGQMATIGRSKAVAMSGPLQMTGLLAWLAWLFIHLMYLVGFRNRVAVLLEWAWAYLTFQRSARVVLDLPRQLPASEPATPLIQYEEE